MRLKNGDSESAYHGLIELPTDLLPDLEDATRIMQRRVVIRGNRMTEPHRQARAARCILSETISTRQVAPLHL